MLRYRVENLKPAIRHAPILFSYAEGLRLYGPPKQTSIAPIGILLNSSVRLIR